MDDIAKTEIHIVCLDQENKSLAKPGWTFPKVCILVGMVGVVLWALHEDAHPFSVSHLPAFSRDIREYIDMLYTSKGKAYTNVVDDGLPCWLKQQEGMPCRNRVGNMIDGPQQSIAWYERVRHGALYSTFKDFLYHMGNGVLNAVGWSTDMHYAKMLKAGTMQSSMSNLSSQLGMFVLVVPGDEETNATNIRSPFVSIHEDSVLCRNETNCPLPIQEMNTLFSMVWSIRGRDLNRGFRINIQHLPWCDTGLGACSIWEVHSNTVVFHTSIVQRLSASSTATELLHRFVLAFTSSLGDQVRRDPAQDHRLYPEAQHDIENEENQEVFDQSSTVANLVAAAVITAGMTAVHTTMSIPYWWCVSCPIVLGLLLPFAFNFGLIGAANEACSLLHLEQDACTDVCLSACALAAMLSFASVVPIISVCQLKRCFS